MSNITNTKKEEFKGSMKVNATVKTPEGVASFPHLIQPDEYMGKKQYKTDLRLDPRNPETATFIEEVTAWEDKAKVTQRANLESQIAKCKGARDADKKSKLEGMLADIDSDKYKSLLSVEYDRESGDPTGNLTLRAKMNAEGGSGADTYTMQPKIYNATGRVDNATAPDITAGSTLRLNLKISTYEMPSSGFVGVSIRLQDVLIVKLNEGGGSAGGSNPFGNDTAHQPETFDSSGESDSSDEY
jgi:hypothetical protein